ncbi:MAG: D-arabinose 5-phosphate isomerase [Gemmatimonadetes bacterium GWC2_71_10]|nr:MAG: D-arabinose 5-phosphate isomerase [Gemmatimonadetes bacterium GWC2_71_10]
MSPSSDGRNATVRRGQEVLRQEAGAMAAVAGRLGDSFAAAVELLAGTTGRVVVSGVGKSGVIARKIAATLTSTGTPAVFLHPVDGLHGDLGLVGRNDAAIVLSKSGETGELLALVGHLKRLGTRIVAITGNTASSLARDADVALDGAVDAEACPFDLAPTTSTTVALALGDALAIATFEAKGFKPSDFAALHPGGSLGRRLLLRVADVMVTSNLPVIPPTGTMRQCVLLLAERRGTVAVVDGQGRVSGVVTSGDLTRLMEKRDDFLGVAVAEVMTKTPKLAHADELAGTAVYRMEQAGIMALPVVDEGGVLVGIVHLHDLMRAGAA